VSTEPVTPDLSTAPGILLGAELRWGSRAERIRDLAVSEPDISQVEIAERVGCTQGNVSQVLKSFLRDHSLAELQELQANKADVYETVLLHTLASITPDKLAKASYSQLVMGAAILEDKARLVRGQPTAIHMNVLVDVLDVLRMQERNE
jgi:hypothetical protein